MFISIGMKSKLQGLSAFERVGGLKEIVAVSARKAKALFKEWIYF